MVRRIKLGLCGLGSVAQRGILPHLACADAQERVATVACCDIVAGRAADTARRFGWLEAYEDLGAMLAQADIEAVVIATPIPLHHAQVLASLAAGKHVCVMKPMATTLAQADEVITAADRAGLTVVASPGQMLRPLYQHLHGLIRGGAIGKVYWAFSAQAGGTHEADPIRVGADAVSHLDPTWYYRLGGGPVYDVTVYALHALTGILGPARSVAAMSGIALRQRHWRRQVIDVEVDDNTLMLLDFGESTFAVAGGQSIAATAGIGTGRLTFFGSEGTVDVVFEAGGSEQGGDLAGVEIVAPKALGGTFGFGTGTFIGHSAGEPPHVVGPHLALPERLVYADIMHLVDCLIERRPPVASPLHARHVIEIIEAAYRSARTGQTQALSTDFPVPSEAAPAG